jgi:uncharacterized membrane protein YkoI
MRNPTLRAGAFAVVAATLVLCGDAAAQQNDARRGREDARGAPPRNYQRFDPPPAREGPIRREPGPGSYGPPPGPYAPPGYPSPPYRRPPEMSGLGQHRITPLSDLIEGLKRRSPGRELDADLTSVDGRPAYRILWVTVHGRRMDMIIDAETGAVLSER